MTILVPLFTSLVFVLFLPLYLFAAWMRVKMWDWFMVPYFHAPHVSVWLMFAIGLFVSLFQNSAHPELKKEFYKASEAARIWGPIVVQLITFGLAYLIHIWILKGSTQ